MQLILQWLLNTLSLVLVAYFIPGISFSSYYSALIAALFLGMVNTIIKPILMILTLPINILTLGFFTLVINAFLFWLVASFIKGFEISSFSSAFWAALVYSILTWIINSIVTHPHNK